MTKPRNQQVSLDATPFYHCMVRCVRRAFLCGEDRVTGTNYDHRKQWLVSRMRFLSYVYAIDICAYAVMSNHYHMVLHVDEARAQGWSDEEVVERWLQLYHGNPLVERWQKDKNNMSSAELDKVAESIATWRERLCSISWFMRNMNETIARMANEEDGCKGRFWEGRFKSQALLDEGALLTCMAYVDLNPVRAALADDVIDSDYTSIQQRLFEYAQTQRRKTPVQQKVVKRVKQRQVVEQAQAEQVLADCTHRHYEHALPQASLMTFDGSSHASIHKALPFTYADYFALVDTTGRAIREDKRGFIAQDLPPLLERLGLDADCWIDHVRLFGVHYGDCAGSQESMQQYAQNFGRCWVKGVGCTRVSYLS